MSTLSTSAPSCSRHSVLRVRPLSAVWCRTTVSSPGSSASVSASREPAGRSVICAGSVTPRKKWRASWSARKAGWPSSVTAARASSRVRSARWRGGMPRRGASKTSGRAVMASSMVPPPCSPDRRRVETHPVRTEPAPLVDTQKLRGSDRPVEFRLVPTWDGLYTPIASCLPAGEGPHAVVVLAYGNGGGGLPWVRDAVRDRDLVVEQVLAAGYGAVWIDYRTEVELGYHRGGPLTRDVRSGGEVFNRSPLEFEDQRAVVEYLAARPDIDGDRIAAVGCSHAGEMLLKLTSG